MVDVQSPFFINPDFAKLRMSNNNTAWFDNDISAFLNVQDISEEVMEFPQSVPSASPIADHHYYPSSSPETTMGGDSPYASDVSQTPSPFDASLFVDSPSPSEYTASIDVDPSLFEPCNLSNPLLLPEIEKILANTPSFPSDPLPHSTHEGSTKKRQREENKSDVSLTREQLLTMTSKEIEDYVSQLKTKRTLTASEEKDLKRQRRLVKNREYASQSRSRKKQYVEEVEKQLEQSKAETEAVRKQNHLLSEENKILKKQLSSIADAVRKSQAAGSAPPLSGSSGSIIAKFATIGGGRNAPAKTMGACLLAVFFMVFTFAAFWDNEPLGMTLYPNPDKFVFQTRHLKDNLKGLGTDSLDSLPPCLRTSHSRPSYSSPQYSPPIPSHDVPSSSYVSTSSSPSSPALAKSLASSTEGPALLSSLAPQPTLASCLSLFSVSGLCTNVNSTCTH